VEPLVSVEAKANHFCRDAGLARKLQCFKLSKTKAVVRVLDSFFFNKNDTGRCAAERETGVRLSAKPGEASMPLKCQTARLAVAIFPCILRVRTQEKTPELASGAQAVCVHVSLYSFSELSESRSAWI
jgi:hypothetical protein